ncbi:aminotransferase class V-fold PLP-dependent enzyme [Microbacterium sp. Marseille-Q6965]|uniref:aminotransferase class V-fold PLP-dependent enzyme n=1 Tax=Microbacterium sp. Marseille-Q6965 TaxID=2965072 RepID=UPI0021B7A51F|nr:aminotransferase class V-fold PLP-dependent enzyme [Microbacterium sp. Marseille-Q6965]
MSSISDYRATFTGEPGYLNFAAFGPLSATVRDEVVADVNMLGTGRASSIDHVAGRVREAREAVAELLGGVADEVTLQPSTSYGMAQAVFGLEGGVLASAAEFPTIPTLIVRAAESFGRVTPQWMTPPSGFVTPEAVADALRDDTRALVVSSVDSRTGFRADLRALREVLGEDRLLIVDDTQGFGTIVADYAAADVVCGHGYKWLRAGRGTGFAWFGARAREVIRPVLSGHVATEAGIAFDEVPPPHPTAQAYRLSEPDWLAASRLAAAVSEVAAVGVAAIQDELGSLTDRVIALADAHGMRVLTPREPERRAGFVALAPRPEHVAPLAAALANRGVTVTSRSNLIRVAPHVGTDDETFGMLADALAAAPRGA